MADLRKIVLDDVILEAAVVRQNLLEELAQRRDVPLAVAKLVDRASDRLGRRYLEGAVERAALSYHAEPVIEHDQGLAHGIDDGLGEASEFLCSEFGLDTSANRRK